MGNIQPSRIISSSGPSTTQHQATVTHHADGSKTIQLGSPAPLVGKSAYPAVPGCQPEQVYCNYSQCSVPYGPGTPASAMHFCCSTNGSYCNGKCFSNINQTCPRGERIYPCIGCSPS